MDQLDKLYQEISPSRDDCENYPKKLNQAAEHLVNVLDGKDRQVVGTTYKELKELITLINDCGYFERAPKTESEGMFIIHCDFIIIIFMSGLFMFQLKDNFYLSNEI